MVIYIFRVIRGTSLCADELWLCIYSEVFIRSTSLRANEHGYLYVQRYYGHSLCADELWLFIYSEVLGGLLSVLMS